MNDVCIINRVQERKVQRSYKLEEGYTRYRKVSRVVQSWVKGQVGSKVKVTNWKKDIQDTQKYKHGRVVQSWVKGQVG